MKSYFDADDKPKVDVKVVGLDGQIDVPALTDTGFDGTLMLSLPKALSIGLKLSTVVPIELADGPSRTSMSLRGRSF